MSASVIVFGGTFDPVHVGHLSVAEQVLELTGADALWFVIAALPPLRPPAHASPQARLAMLSAAVDGNPRFAVVDSALQRGGVSYTADTMDALRRDHPDADFSILVGADAARSIRQWHRAPDLLARERFVIVNRSGTPPLSDDEASSLGFAPERTTLLKVYSPPVSASEVRRRAAARESLNGVVPAAVAKVIVDLGLYQ